MTAAESVVIRDSGGFVRQGTVETVMPDASGLWIEGTGIEPRQYFDKASGFEVWVQSPGEAALMTPADYDPIRLRY